MNYIKNNTTNKLDTRKIRSHKFSSEKKLLSMLTCYDFQTAQLLNETELDLILVGDSLGNVILGLPTTIPVSIEEMCIFSKAVKRGAPEKFVVADLPFGEAASMSIAIKSATKLFKESGVEALKIEGAFDFQCKIIKRLTEIGIPIMGHIGLTPQSVHEQGGYFTHGKTIESSRQLMSEAMALQAAGVFAIVLECVEKDLSAKITKELKIPTIGIGSGSECDGQVLVINDLLGNGNSAPPKFCKPIGNLYQLKKELIEKYLYEQKNHHN